MKDLPLVSVLIPLYNAEKYIAKTLESVLTQSYENIEIIVLDDGSTDKSLAIAKDYEMQYENIKVFSHENSGAQVTRNKLFELSLGDYIQYLDADDLLHKDKIKSQIDLLKNEDSKSIAFGQWTTFSKDTLEGTIFRKLSIYKNYTDTIEFLIDMWSSLEAISPHAWLIPRILIKESTGWHLDLIKNQDGEFFARIVSQAKKAVFCEDSKVFYRIDSQNSISKNYSQEAAKSLLLSFDWYANILKNDLYRPKSKFALAKVYSNFLFDLYPEHSQLYPLIEARLNTLGFDKPIPIKNYKLLDLSYKLFGAYNNIKILKAIKKNKYLFKLVKAVGKA